MSIQIVTDSGSDITPEMARRYGITVVPLQVLINGHTYEAGVDLTAAEFYAKMREGRELPKTSQPTPHALMAAYKAAQKRGPVVAIHVSGALSGTVQNATMVARDLSSDIHVFDSRTGSGGQAMLVLEAAEMAQAGADLPAILRRLEELRARNRQFVLLNTLENAVKGGRVNPLAGMAANLLGIKVIVQVTDEGKVVPAEKVRGRAKATDRLLELGAEHAGSDWSERRVAIAHGGCPEEAEAFAARVRERYRPRDILMTEIGPTIGTYAAEGALLFSF